MDTHHDQASGPLAPAAVPDVQAGDTLSDVLEAVKLTGALFFLVDATTPWVAEAPASTVLAPVILPRAQHVVSYHVVREGACWCETPGREPLRLEAGDVIVVPHGHAYALTSEPGLRTGFTADETLGWFRSMALGQLPFVVSEGGGGPDRIRVVCGFLGCDALPFNPVLATLPELLHVRRPAAAGGDRLARSSSSPWPNRATARRPSVRPAADRRAGVRRSRAATPGDAAAVASGWLGGLRDPVVGRALAACTPSPRTRGRSRTGARCRVLALGAGGAVRALRRAAADAVPRRDGGCSSPRAGSRDCSAKVSAVARDVGYESEAAFSRAFKKLTGVGPALWRSRQHEAGERDRTFP